MSGSVTMLTPTALEPITTRVLAVVARETHLDPTKLRGEATLAELNVDSVDVVMILNGIEEEFGVYVPVEQGFSSVKTLQDFASLVAGLVRAQAKTA